MKYEVASSEHESIIEQFQHSFVTIARNVLDRQYLGAPCSISTVAPLVLQGIIFNA